MSRFSQFTSPSRRPRASRSHRQGALFAVLGASALWLLSACSAVGNDGPGDGTGSKASGSSGAAGGSTVPVGDGNPGDLAVVTVEGEQASIASGASSEPVLNVGTETLCDGKDDNNNGIIDDVDVGKDGLCDCIRLGFFGEIASDAGEDTGKFEAWLEARSGAVPFKYLGASATLTPEWLADLHVLIVGGMQDRAGTEPAFAEAELAALEAWVTAGGGLVTLAGYTNEREDAKPTDELLGRFGLHYDLDTVDPEGVINEGAPPIWLTGIVAPMHPTVNGVAQVGFYAGYPVTGAGTVILREGGDDLAVAAEVGDGRIFAFGDEWITQDQTWSGRSQGQNDPCQQPCDEEANICPIAEAQCAQCETQPCSDPNDTEPDCQRGCTQSCANETERCEGYQATCASCTLDAATRADATPRLWLNTISWLTPGTECQVPIPVGNIEIAVIQ